MMMGIFLTLQTVREREREREREANEQLLCCVHVKSAHLSSFMAILSGSVSPSSSTITGAPMLCVCVCVR